MPLLNRLCGLETELAIRAKSGRFKGQTWRRVAFQVLVQQLIRWTPSATALNAKEGVFLANGGAIWFEGERIASGSGLIELSTPECRGPRQVLAYQRAMERLVRQAAEALDIALIKNDQDAHGAVYGGQENYEAVVGGPLDLWLWRLGLCLLTPLILLCWLGVLVTLAGLLLYFIVTGVVVSMMRLVSGARASRAATLLWGRDVVKGHPGGIVMPPWLEAVLIRISTAISAPLAGALAILAKATLFRRTRRLLTPFLVSRGVITGVGLVDRAGRFVLADKAPAVNCLVGYSGFLRMRPIYGMGHFFKAACIESFFHWRDFADLFRPRQRLQIALGDSNMAEPAEFLKVGMTSLILDAIEAGFLDDAPILTRPIRALHAFIKDWTLQATARDRRGREWTALEIQHWYLAACHRFVAQYPGGQTDEVEEVLSAWEDALHSLDLLADDPADDSSLIGTLDWPTKRYLLDQAGPAAKWAVRKKIDLRYHELTEHGYYETIREAGLAPQLLDEESIERAMRWPPSGTPAALRGRTIREFTGGSMQVSANWKRVVLRNRHSKRLVRLDEAHGGSARARRSRILSRRKRD